MGDDTILLAEQTIILSDNKEVTVKEFKYLESIKLASKCSKFINDLAKIVSDDGEVRYSKILEAIGNNTDDWIMLLSESSGLDRQYIESLNDTDGETLAIAFWEVNGSFLLRRVLTIKQMEMEGLS